MRLVLRLTLVVTLAGVGVPPVPAQEVPSIESGAATLSVAHDPVTCMVANQHPQLDAVLAPLTSVQAGRVFFHSALGSEFYYVEMQAEGGRFVGTLPAPSLDAGPVTYYVEGLGEDFTQTQSAETRAIVVEDEGDCEGRVAAIAPPGTPVQVFSVSGTTALPPGFGGVTSVLSGAGAAVAGGGSFLTSPAGLAVMGAALIGIGIIIANTGGQDPPPVSGSR